VQKEKITLSQLESFLFKSADKLCKHVEPSDDKHVALGLIFLKYLVKVCEARQPIPDTPVHLLQERIFHLRASIRERSTLGFAA
jgi:hypothetical protein